MRRLILAAGLALVGAVVLVEATDGPLRSLANLALRTDENGYLRISAGAPGATDGPLRTMANLRGRTDENGYLRVALAGAGTIDVPGIAATSTNGFVLTNSTPSTVGTTAQWSPRFQFCGSAWKSNATAVSEVDCWIIEDRPVTGAAATTSSLVFARSLAGGAYTDVATMSSSLTTTFVQLASSNSVTASANVNVGGSSLTLSGTAPTISSGFGGSPSITAGTSTAFRLNVGSGGSATGGVLAMPTATTGWNCMFADVTTPASFVTVMTASTTATVTIANYSRTTGLLIAWTAGDIVAGNCVAF